MRVIAISTLMFVLVTADAWAQTPVNVSVRSSYRDLTTGKPIAPDFAGLGFEAAAERPGNAGVKGYFFSPSNTQLITLFQQMGVRNLRLGGGTADGCGTPVPQYYDPPDFAGSPDINQAFEFARSADVNVIYTLRMVNHKGCFIPDLASQDARYARFIWNHYQSHLLAFSFSNETDFHSAHTFCKAAGQCTCVYGVGCSGDAASMVVSDPLIYETAVPGGRSVAGTAFPSYLADWISFATVLRNPVSGTPGAPLAGPDSGDYTGGGTNFSGVIPGCNDRNITRPTGWTRIFADCRSESNDLLLPTQHYYVGASPSATVNGTLYTLTPKEAIDNMLSPAWVSDDRVTIEPYQPFGIPSSSQLTFTGYPWLNNFIPPGTRLTELNDYLGGIVGASNSFASALWTLDIMHWLALHGSAGVNFHNNQWISTDTVVPGNLTTYGVGKELACTTVGVASACGNFVINPKGYAIKAFDLGGHGYPRDVTLNTSAAPSEFNLTAYAVASAQDLYITLINKTQGTASGDTASVIINPANSRDSSFRSTSASSILLWDGVLGDPSQTSATIGGASILNTGAQWSGVWTPQRPDANGRLTLLVAPSTAVVVRFHANSNYVGPIQANENGALEIFAIDPGGNVWHSWQKTALLNEEPNSAMDHWSDWTEHLSGLPGRTFAQGDVAVTKNLDNTLEVFVHTGDGPNSHVLHNRQKLPHGDWRGWMDMGQSSAGLSHLVSAQNADGGLSVFALDPQGGFWTATENAPGVAWSDWRELNGKAIRPGYGVVRNQFGRLEAFGIDQDGEVSCINQTITNTWSAWTRLGAPFNNRLQAGVQVVANEDGGVTIFSMDAKNHLWTMTRSSLSGDWGAWVELAASPSPLQLGYVAGRNSDGRVELVGVGHDGIVYHVRAEVGKGWGGWASLGGPPDGMDPHLVIGNTNDGRLQIFGTGKGSHSVWSNWQSSHDDSWQSRWAVFYGEGLVFYR